MRSRLVGCLLFTMVLASFNQGYAFQSEKEIKDWTAKNVNISTDFNRTKGAIAAIPKKIVIGGLNVRFVIVPYRGPKLGGMLGFVGETAIKGQVFDSSKSLAETYVPLIVQSFQQNFKPAKIEFLPINTASSSKSYREAKFETAIKSYLPAGIGFGAAWEYAAYDQWRIPAADLKFLTGGDFTKKLFPGLLRDAGADGILLVQVNLLRHPNDDIRIGDCLLEIYTPGKSGKENIVAFSANIKNVGETSNAGLKKEDWKTKDGKNKKIEEYWPILGKLFGDLFTSYGFLIDQGIK
jgi:hypothetical protein